MEICNNFKQRIILVFNNKKNCLVFYCDLRSQFLIWLSSQSFSADGDKELFNHCSTAKLLRFALVGHFAKFLRVSTYTTMIIVQLCLSAMESKFFPKFFFKEIAIKIEHLDLSTFLRNLFKLLNQSLQSFLKKVLEFNRKNCD